MTFVLDCDTWQGRIRPTDGYGVDGQRPAHRVVFEQVYGPIGNGRHIHHLCGNPACVTPDHLLSVTPGQHSSMFGAKPPKKQFCSRGHDVSIRGRYSTGTCRQCAIESARAWTLRRRDRNN